MPEPPKTWHYGLIARWWAEFNQDGPEIPYFRKFIEAGGQPALDVGCGTGRLLLPYLRAGLDVDGCDVSSDMIALCREKAEAEGLSPNLSVQAMHELSIPRAYRTVFVCGAFGLGSTREQDLEALVRIHEYLEPGGTLVLDNEVPYADADAWRYWTKDARTSLPEALEPPGRRRRASDGTEYSLSSRIVELDPLEQRLTFEMHAEMWRGGDLVAEEDRRLTEHLYFRDELVLMIERAGFGDVRVEGGYEGEGATPDHDFLVYIAKK
ncbi:MAG: class I SAM-dependent methyltransferase [Actinomycetota bacterium]|nr:class I SAM-dependent methyltransferase [Actinomycetota bacterium]